MDDPFDLPPDVLRRIPLFAELAKVLSWRGGPVNWDLARQVAISLAAGETVIPAVDESDQAEAAEHVRVAEMWLAESTSLPSSAHLVSARAVTPVEWAEHAPEILGELIEPVAAKILQAVSGPPPGEGPDAMLIQTVSQMAPMFTGVQAGTIIGHLARDVTGAHELGMPATDDGLLLVLDTIDRAAIEFQIDRRQFRQWIALEAAAHRMAYEGFPWLRAHFFALYHNYVASLDVDLARGVERLRNVDLSDPQRVQDALGDEGLFLMQPSPETAQAAGRVARLLALAHAHTTAAVETAGTRTGNAARISEALARRRASSSTGASMLRSFIGLDPSQEQRAASIFVRAILARGGWSTLNRMWDDTDSLPTDAEIADPEAWLARSGG